MKGGSEAQAAQNSPLTKPVAIAEAFCAQHPTPRGRGRPPSTVRDSKQLHNLSWRKLKAFCRSLLPWVPDFSTLHDRVRRIPPHRGEEFNRWLREQVLGCQRLELVLVDGTGWGFGLPYWATRAARQELRRLLPSTAWTGRYWLLFAAYVERAVVAVREGR